MSNKLAINDLPLADRPYEKLSMRGSASLTEAELLAIIICSGHQKMSAIELAQDIVSTHETLSEIRRLSIEELRKFKGIGFSKAVRIKAAFELGRRAEYQQKTELNPQILCSKDAISIMEQDLVSLEQEEFHVLLLDVKGRLIKRVQVARGGLNSTALYPREIFRQALKANAAAMILCHNHPSGDAKPSTQDIQASMRLIEMGEHLGVKVLDHIIIASKGSSSLKSLDLI